MHFFIVLYVLINVLDLLTASLKYYHLNSNLEDTKVHSILNNNLKMANLQTGHPIYIITTENKI